MEAIQYRKDMLPREGERGVPYSTWVKKSREDLSTLTWQELAERMKKPYDPDARTFTDDAGARERDARSYIYMRRGTGDVYIYLCNYRREHSIIRDSVRAVRCFLFGIAFNAGAASSKAPTTTRSTDSKALSVRYKIFYYLS